LCHENPGKGSICPGNVRHSAEATPVYRPESGVFGAVSSRDRVANWAPERDSFARRRIRGTGHSTELPPGTA